MGNGYFENKSFDAIDFTTTRFERGEYEDCSFSNCNFSGIDLSNTRFIECSFKDCNLSNVKTIKTSFNSVRFHGCKLLGINFETCDEFLFSVELEHCALNFSSFYKRSLKTSTIRHCQLQEVDFTECDMSGLVLHECDLTGAKFENTNLEKVDLCTAYHYSINPELNKIKKARFSVTGITGLLDKYDIIIE